MERVGPVLIVGDGAREHSLAWMIAQSPLVERVLCSPGNGGFLPAECRNVAADDMRGIVRLAKKERISLVVIGPEVPLVAGLVDELTAEGIRAFGPNRAAAQLEGSKVYAREFCGRWGIPIARGFAADDYDDACRIVHDTGFLVVKADGPCGGKGVTVANTEIEAASALYFLLVKERFGAAGKRVVIEERLHGVECSLMLLCDGVHAVPLPAARDYKRVGEGDTGPNTGGMGAYAPHNLIDHTLMHEIMERIVYPTLRGMAAEGAPFRGVLYVGLMLTADGPVLIEYNVRFGDPECQTILPLIESDIVPYLIATLEDGGLAKLEPPAVSDNAAVCTVLASLGYPNEYETGFPIRNIEEASKVALIFHAGTHHMPLMSAGGRVLSCVGVGDNLEEARQRSEYAIDLIELKNGFYRKDIARI